MTGEKIVHYSVAISGLLAACSWQAQLSDPVMFVNPTLTVLSVRHYPFRFHGEWGLFIAGSTEQGPSALTEDTRIRATLRTSAGDVEELWLRPAVCREGDKEYYCFSFAVSMKRGHHAEELRPLLNQVPAKFSYVLNSGTWGEMAVLGKEDLRSTMRAVRAWPGVSSAAPAFGGRVSTYGATSTLGFVTVMPVAFGDPTANDGVVQARPGDEVTVEYQQPDIHDTLSASVTMCDLEGAGVPIAGLGQDPPCS